MRRNTTDTFLGDVTPLENRKIQIPTVNYYIGKVSIGVYECIKTNIFPSPVNGKQ